MRTLDDFVTMVKDVACVEQVQARVNGSYMHIITYVNHGHREQRFQVYEAEKYLLLDNPGIQFEFDLIDRRGEPLVEGEIATNITRNIRRLPDATEI